MKLTPYLILLGGIAMSTPSIAKKPGTPGIPQVPGMSPRVHQMLNAKLRGFDRTVREAAAPTGAKTTAMAQRLSAQAYYEWTGTTPAIVDSAWLRYGGTRGSKFGEYILYYDFNNGIDKPGTVEYQDTYVNYDTLRYNTFSTGSTGVRFRNYNAANKVTLSETPMEQRTVYSYLNNGKLDRVTTIGYNGASYDTVQREFYLYNLTGVVKDSIEVYDSSSTSWQSVANYVFNYTGAQMTSIQLDYNLGIMFVPVFRQDYTYGSNGKIVRVIAKQADQTTLQLSDAAKDSIGYSGATMISEDYFQVDPNSGSFMQVYRERRRLNAQGQPDSVSQLDLSGSGNSDFYLKLAYNANGYPTLATTYDLSNNAPQNQFRYYYEQNPNSVATVPALKPLTLAPNPAVNQVRLDNQYGGSYRVLDINGRLMIEGNLAAGGTIGVESLAPGMYSVILNAVDGERFSGRFVKQ